MHYVTKRTLNVCVLASPNVVIYIPPGEQVTTDDSGDAERITVKWRGRAYLAARAELSRSVEPEREPVG
jgi:hypothetical protein